MKVEKQKTNKFGESTLQVWFEDGDAIKLCDDFLVTYDEKESGFIISTVDGKYTPEISPVSKKAVHLTYGLIILPDTRSKKKRKEELIIENTLMEASIDSEISAMVDKIKADLGGPENYSNA